MWQPFPVHVPFAASSLPPSAHHSSTFAGRRHDAQRFILFGPVLVALRSHSRPHQLPAARRQRMKQRPSYDYTTGLQEELYFLNCPTNAQHPGRSQNAKELRYKIKQCRSASSLLQLLEEGVSEEIMEASVIGAAMQTCGYQSWWGTFMKVRSIQQKHSISLFVVERNIAMTALSHCLKHGGKFGAIQQRKQAVLRMAQEIWQEVPQGTSTDHDSFNCGLSSAVKMARCVDSPEALEWGLEVWRQADDNYSKSIITFATYAHFLEHYELHDKVDALLADKEVEKNCVLLGALLDSAASRGHTARAGHLWRSFVSKHDVTPNLLCYNAFAKAFLISGHPTRVVRILRPVVDAARSQGNFQLVGAYIQSLLVLYHSSLAAEHLRELRPLLKKTPPRSYAKDWKRFDAAARHLAAGRLIPLSEVLIEWKARTRSSMANWKDAVAGSGYLAELEPARVEKGRLPEVTEMSRFLARPTDFAYLVTEVTAGGQVRSMTITRGALLRETALRPRDLRAVSVRPSGGSEVGPMLGRRSGLLLGLGGVRAVVEEERALMFGPPGRDQIRFLRVLENQKRLAAQEIGLAQAGSFRMIFVESALLALSRRLASRLLEIRQRTEPKLRAPPVLREPDLEEVRQLRRSLVRCASQASAVSSSLLSRLDGDEAKLLAAGDGDSAASHDEWEALLEAYLQAYSELSRQCTSLLMDIEDFEGSTSLALQARRLRVEQFELSLVIASVSIAAGGLVPGAMGMNLLTGWENSDSAFRVAILVTCLVVITLFFTIRFLASRQGFLL
ncbi:unnamed protein product [Effrenium voratum]|uniref:Uncharacterized protein n=1 Tax=Effrenium voratum TaxID=2562239 RepID=A0AA36ILJ0_9DINO|nr:unnamed protein product [Effrenium voratum]